MVRPSELTMPVVSVPSNPNGLPMASTFCPTTRASELPSGRDGQLAAGVDLDQRQVVARVRSQDFRLVDFLVRQRDGQLRGCRSPRGYW